MFGKFYVSLTLQQYVATHGTYGTVPVGMHGPQNRESAVQVWKRIQISEKRARIPFSFSSADETATAAVIHFIYKRKKKREMTEQQHFKIFHSSLDQTSSAADLCTDH